eukprot:gene19410-23243_t
MLGGQHNRSDRAKINKLTDQFKKVSVDFEREATEIINLQLNNAIGTGGRSNDLSLNGRKNSSSMSDRIQYTNQKTAIGAGYEDRQQQPQYNQMEITLQNAQPVEELLIQEYNTEVKNLVTDLQAIRDIANDLHSITVEQGEQLKVADKNVAVAAIDVKDAHGELKSAYVYKTNYRKKVVILVVLIVILAAIVIGIAVGVTR